MSNNQRLLWIAGGGLGALICVALVAIYLLGGRDAGESTSVLTRLQNGLAVVTGSPQSGAPLRDTGPFAFRRLEIDVSKPQAEACLVFTRTLDAGGRTHYED